MSITRKDFFSTDDIFNEASEKIQQLQESGEKIDYLTFVPDGEPTLDINLGKTIERLKSFGIKIAVITNSSLMWNKEVQNDLMKADWVSVKIDSVCENIWRKINRPHGSLELTKIMTGLKEFAATFDGMFVTETMLVKGINDSLESLSKTAQFIGEIHPCKSYILAPTRPPAEKSVEAPSEEVLNTAYQIYSSLLEKVELIVHNEGMDFSYSSDVEKELLSILAVHPMRKDAVEEFLSRSYANWDLIDNLIFKEQLKEVSYSDNTFLIKNITR
jgi:wyosine [tRNA(Phe)-imidazoG37] synthetase (radical SAM superfamily)